MRDVPTWFRPIQRILFRFWLLKRGLTLGVRAIVLDGAGRVLLVRHSYVPGWYFPGGGVEAGETALAALARELEEEAGVTLTGAPALHGLFHNRSAHARDHVAAFVVRDFAQTRVPEPNAEIREHGFFALDALPEGTTGATRRRLAEVLNGVPVSAVW